MKKVFHFNNKNLLERRRQLRNNPSPPEIMLWGKIKNRQLGYKFIRQYSVDGYVIDFFCPKLHIAIEVDGKYHQLESRKKYDIYRDKWLLAFNIKTIRIPAVEIMNNVEKVITSLIPLLNQEGGGGVL